MKKSVEPGAHNRKAVQRYITMYIRDHGYAPTFDEIAEYTGIVKSHVREVVKSLAASGAIKWTPGKARGIALPNRAWSASPLRPQRSERVRADEPPMPKNAHVVKPNADTDGPANPRPLFPRLVPSYATPLMGTIAGGAGVVLFEADAQLGSDQFSLPGTMLPANIDPKSVFALLVQGDSMRDDGIAEGDVVFVVKTDVWASNDIMAVYIKNEQAATLKRLIQTERGLIELRPANPAFTSRIVSPEEIEVQGRVLAVIKKM